MSKIFFTSDPHYFHQNVIKYCNRPFEDVEKMNWGLVKAWNEVVGKDDTVYILGDFSLAFRPVEIFPMQLNGTKYLVSGNHDFVNSYNKKSRNPENQLKWIKKYEENGLLILPEHTTLDIPGVAVVNLVHIPPSCKDGRYVNLKGPDNGRWTLHGHTHSKSKAFGKEIHVGVDAWEYKPVPIEEIKKIILENPNGLDSELY